jgi:hypothetical protein
MNCGRSKTNSGKGTSVTFGNAEAIQYVNIFWKKKLCGTERARSISISLRAITDRTAEQLRYAGFARFER